MDYLNADTGDMSSTIHKLIDSKPPTYVELKLRCELLASQAIVNEEAIAAMSQEICELNNQILSIIDELRIMQ